MSGGSLEDLAQRIPFILTQAEQAQYQSCYSGYVWRKHVAQMFWFHLRQWIKFQSNKRINKKLEELNASGNKGLEKLWYIPRNVRPGTCLGLYAHSRQSSGSPNPSPWLILRLYERRNWKIRQSCKWPVHLQTHTQSHSAETGKYLFCSKYLCIWSVWPREGH